MMVLQHKSVRKSLNWYVITLILFNAKVGIFPLSYAVIHLLFHCLDPYFIKFLIY